MQKHLLYINLFTITSALALGACADEVANVVTPEVPEVGEKTPIELAMGSSDAPATRAVITDGTGKVKRAFEANTRLFFAFVAENTDGTEKKYGFNYGTAAAATSSQKDAEGNVIADTKSSISFANNYLYWDDAYARDSKVSVYSIAVANKVRGNVKLTPSENIAIGTESPGQAIIQFSTTDPGTPTFKWQIGESDGASNFKQTQNIFEWADLVFSNNIADYTSAGKPDNRLKFHTESGDMYHKFDKGELIYYHALTQFTIKIKCGDGFKGDGSDFKFTNGAGTACTNPDNSFGLNGFYGADGVFYIGNGEFAAMTDANKRNYTSIYKVSETHQNETVGDYYVLKAYVFPGTDMSASGPDNAFSFILDGNKYDISLSTLYTALRDGTTGGTANVLADILAESKYLKAGYNYEFTFTVGKTKINNITAQVVDWENVTAENVSPSNARISLNVEDRSSSSTTKAVTENMDIYRALDESATITDDYKGFSWLTNYTVDGKAKWNNTTLTYNTDRWSTDWYWESNKSYYHFRTLSPTTLAVTQDANGDYTTISSSNATINSSSEVEWNECAWGAPFKDVADDYKFFYNWNKGFDAISKTDNSSDVDETKHQIYKAIGPTKSTIPVLMFHLMSCVNFNIKTTSGDDKVILCKELTSTPGTYQHTTVQLVGYYPSGKVLLGTGLVKADGTITTVASPASIDCKTATTGQYDEQKYYYNAIPQDLTNVKLYITTPDDNQYIVDLATIKTSTEPTTKNLAQLYDKDSDNKYTIGYWYPNYQYTYNLTLKKTGVELKATIVEWEQVSASDDVQIR